MLERAIRGRGAFSRFKDTVYNLGMEKIWFQYKADAYQKLAIEWCREHGIEYYEG